MSSGFLGADAAPPQPEARADLGADGQGGRRLAPTTAHPSSLAEHPLCRQTPEVGAGCGKSARPDLCGGRPATDVPTANATSPSARVLAKDRVPPDPAVRPRLP